MPKGHAEALPEIVSQTLDQAGLSFKDIGKLATSIGPGTFTGVRVGLSAARGFSLALDLPLVGVTSLETIAAGVENYRHKTVLAAFDARRNEVYAQIFDKGEPRDTPKLLTIEQASELAGELSLEVVGTAGPLLTARNDKLTASKAPALPDAGIVATLASQREGQNKVQPLYLRRADAKAQKPLLNIEPGNFGIVPVNLDHRDILARIHTQGFSSPWTAKSFATCLVSPGVSGFLAIDGKNEPLGFIIFRDVEGEREILTIAVRLDARRRSVAGFLLSTMYKNAVEKRVDKIFLEVSENNFAAQNLYRKTGYATCGRRKKYYTENDGQKYDAIIMEQPL